jgi:putative RNA 2'-phosphotransferase
MARQKSLKRLAKLITYALGRKPAEFGLFLDPNGFVKLKEFLKAIHQEDGLKYVRRSHIEEILISQPNPPIEIKANLIRARNRDKLPRSAPAQNLPKLLYTCVRRKAYPVVFQKGIVPSGHHRVVLSSCRNLAERIGKRIDSKPVLLTVQTQKSIDQGLVFYTAGQDLFSAESIPKDCFTGPPLPQQKIVTVKQEIAEEHKGQHFPGSYFIDLQAPKDRQKTLKHKKKSNVSVRGKNSKRLKKQKLQKKRPPWRS